MQELVAARGGQVENLPLLGAAVFAVGLLQDETDERFIVQLIDKRVGATVAEAPRGWQEFVQLDRLARGMGPKFDAPPLPEAQARRQYMCDYLNAAIAFGALSRVKELQEFVGYTEFVQQERRRAAGLGSEPLRQLRHVSPRRERRQAPPASLQEVVRRPSDVVRSEQQQQQQQAIVDDRLTVVNSSSMRHLSPMRFGEKDGGGYDGDDVVDGGGDGSSSSSASRLQLEDTRILEECFRMMDVGVAGYITPEDMKEFFMCVDGVSASPCSDFLRLGKDELCNCDRFVALTLAALRSSSRGSRTLGEWVDHYWLLQYRKIFMGTAALMNWDAELTTIPPEPTHGFDSFELATLLFALTEAGLRLVNAVEVEQWVRSGQHRRGCAITMEQLATLLDTLSKAVPFSETWLALLQHRSSSKQKVLEIINTYSAVADATVVEELREHIMQLKRDTMAGGRCANCSRLEEVLQQQAVRLADMEAARESSEVNLGHLERRFEERAEAFAQLQQDYWHVQMLLEDAQLHEVELAEALENAKGQLPMHPRGGGTLALNTFAAAPPGAVAGDGVPSLLQLMPCGRLAQHMRDSMPIADSPILSTIGAVAYAIPPELSQPSEWCVDVFWCDATRDGRNKIERLVCRDSDGRRSCAFLLKNSELQVVVADYNNSSSSSCGGGGHSFRLTPRRWYRLHCALDWRAKMFDVTVTEVGHGGSAAAALKSTKMTATRASWGPIAMIDAQTSGIAVVDIFPRTELLMSYCNFFLRYTS